MNRITESLLRNLWKFPSMRKYVFRIRRRKYLPIKTFHARINDIDVVFSTEDTYSNIWFFPRYDGGKIHEQTTTEMLLDSLKSASCFVDVGTNLGWYTCLASKHMPQGIVYGFEMDELNYALLEKNLRLNQSANAEIHRLAVSDRPGTFHYEREAEFPSPILRLSHGDPRSAGPSSGRSIAVETVTLDDFFADKSTVPDVVKIDVEGAEIDVLRGMKRLLREHRPILFVEIHPETMTFFDSTPTDVVAFLAEYGYRLSEIEGLREHDSGVTLHRLSRGSVLEENTMIYAEVTT